MIQTHSIILWGKAKNEEFKISAERGYVLMMALKEFATELSPNYLTVMRKKDAKLFEWTYESFENALRKGVNKEGKTMFADLGYRISFFSSLTNENSAGISLSVGVSNPKFINTFIVDLPISYPIYSDQLECDKLILLFNKCVEIFDPFWGCISNKTNMNRYESYIENALPATIHWVNYLGKDIVKQLGVKRIENAPVYTTGELLNGYYLILKPTPIDDNNEVDIDIQKKTNRFFRL